ncbi:MAG: photosynthetic reaction center cytochrome c subunit [Acidobacteria bacterium]|nr:photosynthetic reaction center cytochrome c subunit [Acidobacteriota bacterium]
MKRVSLVLTIVCLTGLVARAQAPMRNLQVWPKDTPPAQILQTMNAFNESLGVDCDYCHVADFASDEKREKRVARQMILLRDAINVMLAAIVDKPAGAGPTAGFGQPGAPIRVLCRDCHHGLPVPRQLTDVITQAAGGGGAAAGLAKYRELRAQFYGGQQYDFSENSLLTMAQRALTSKRPEDAMQYLQANLEYFPRSVRTLIAMAQVKTVTGDRGGAIENLERAVALDPTHAQAQAQLRQLKGQ